MSLLKKAFKKKKFVSLYAALKKQKQQCRTLDDLSFITWLHDRLEGSCRAFRFELPSDLKQLENLDVKTYLLKYCVIPPARQLNYNMAYKKFKNKHTGTIPMKDAFTAVNSLLADSLETTDLQRLFTLLKIANLNELDLRIFSVTTAVAERILYNTIIGNYGRSGLNRSYLECADFFNLAWKLEGINVHPQLKKVLISIG